MDDKTLKAGKQNALPEFKQTGWTADDTMYVYLPDDYYDKEDKYPLILFFPGKGERGNGGPDLPRLLRQGLPKVIEDGKPPFSVDADGNKTYFIVSSLQRSSNINEYAINDWVNTLQKLEVRIDWDKVFFTGLSAGGGDVLKTFNKSNIFASGIVSMSPDMQVGWPSVPLDGFDKAYVWLFNGTNDPTIGFRGRDSYNALVKNNPDGNYKLTMYSGGHCCWTDFYNPEWKEDGQSIYDWMLSTNGEKTSITDDQEEDVDPVQNPEKTIKRVVIEYTDGTKVEI